MRTRILEQLAPHWGRPAASIEEVQTMGVREQFDIRRNNLNKIREDMRGIERVVGIVIYSLKILSLSEWINILLWRRDKAPPSFTDAYVVLQLILSIAIFFFWPCFWLAVLSAYLSGSTVLALLNVVLLRKLFGDMESPERS